MRAVCIGALRNRFVAPRRCLNVGSGRRVSSLKAYRVGIGSLRTAKAKAALTWVALNLRQS
jgi:hypothetical protein